MTDQIGEVERRNRELQGRLVRSPERIKSETGNLGEEVAEKRELVQAAEEMNRHLQAKLDKLQEIEKARFLFCLLIFLFLLPMIDYMYRTALRSRPSSSSWSKYLTRGQNS